jgi:plasmid maintenance system antidote protein VapI
MNQYDLAFDFRVAQSTISQIVTGKRRIDAGGPITVKGE